MQTVKIPENSWFKPFLFLAAAIVFLGLLILLDPPVPAWGWGTRPKCEISYAAHDHQAWKTRAFISVQGDGDADALFPLYVLGGRYAYTDCPDERLPALGKDLDFASTSGGVGLSFHPESEYEVPDRPGLRNRMWAYVGLSRWYDAGGELAMPAGAVIDEETTGLDWIFSGEIRVSASEEAWLKFARAGAVRIGGCVLDTVSRRTIEVDDLVNHSAYPWPLRQATIYHERPDYVLLRWSDVRVANGQWTPFRLDLRAISEAASARILGNPTERRLRWTEFVVGPEFPSGAGEITLQVRGLRLERAPDQFRDSLRRSLEENRARFNQEYANEIERLTYSDEADNAIEIDPDTQLVP